jgi:cation:H+ antiporter
LIGMLPIVYSVSAGAPLAMPLDERQIEEMLLTTAQSIYAVAIIADLRFSIREAMMLLALFACQLLFTDAAARYALSGLYLLMTVVIVAAGGAEKRRAFRELPAFIFGRGE